MGKTRTNAVGAIVKGKWEPGLPYNPWRKEDKAKRRQYSERQPQKVASIRAETSGNESRYQASLNIPKNSTPRKRDGSFYYLGTSYMVIAVKKNKAGEVLSEEHERTIYEEDLAEFKETWAKQLEAGDIRLEAI